MRKKNILAKKKVFHPVQYNTEKKTFFSDKEIIFRSQGRAKVFNISSRAQVIMLSILMLFGAWSFYSYHLYHKSDKIISHKDKEITQTRDAYVDLMSDFMTLHKNIGSMISSISVKSTKNTKELDEYKRQASVVEDKIKQITAEKDWVSDEKMSEKLSLSEVVLQRDLAKSERDELRKQIVAMEDIVDELKAAEMEVFEQIEKIAGKEVGKIKSAFTSINVPLKKKGLYFNALANSKKRSATGGPYVPALKNKISDKKLNDKVSKILNSAQELEYYREVVQYVPLGKPVWSYWVTSEYGSRADPFHGKKAAHKGVDLSSRTGNKIKTKAKGKVIEAKYHGAYGNLVVVDHGNGFKTKYAHLHKIYVKKGAYLEIDDTIGEVGTTGRSTGPHLHYEVLYNGTDVDPLPFIKAKTS